jgi:hypothetical protein
MPLPGTFVPVRPRCRILRPEHVSGTIVIVALFERTEASMATRPHDISDLYLAPVALAVDARIEELGRLDTERLAYEVALESDTPDFTREMREQGLIRTITHLIDTHDWEFSWDSRGLRLTHDAHTFVLGIPGVLVQYLEDGPTA